MRTGGKQNSVDCGALRAAALQEQHRREQRTLSWTGREKDFFCNIVADLALQLRVPNEPIFKAVVFAKGEREGGCLACFSGLPCCFLLFSDRKELHYSGLPTYLFSTASVLPEASYHNKCYSLSCTCIIHQLLRTQKCVVLRKQLLFSRVAGGLNQPPRAD